MNAGQLQLVVPAPLPATLPVPDAGIGCAPPSLPMSLVPRIPSPPHVELHSPTHEVLSTADWQLLFDAVTCRLRQVTRSPSKAAEVLPECIAALQWLQRALDAPPRPGR